MSRQTTTTLSTLADALMTAIENRDGFTTAYAQKVTA